MIDAKLCTRLFNRVKNREKFVLRLFAVLCILGSAVALWRLLWTIVDFFGEDGLATLVQEHTTVTIVVIGLSTFCTAVLLSMFIVAGARLFVGAKKRAALVINIMIALAFVELLCQLTIWGVSFRLIPFFLLLLF